MRGKHGQSALGASLEELDFYGFFNFIHESVQIRQ